MMFEQLYTMIPFITTFLTFYAVYLMLSLSLNLEYGYGGIPNFGHVFFESIGAYVAGNLTANLLNWIVAARGGICAYPASHARMMFAPLHPIWIVGMFVFSIIIAALVGGIFGYLASYPALRLKEDFLAITLIFIGEIGRVVVRNERSIACGLVGLTGVPNPFIWLRDPNLMFIAYTVLAILFAAGSYMIIKRFVNSPFGRLLKSVRDDDLVAMTLGKHVPKARAWALILGSSVAAVAGVIKVFFAQGVFADDYVPLITFVVLSMVILGGMANNKGVLLGALVMTALDFMISPSFFTVFGVTLQLNVAYIKYIITGVVIIAILLFRPQGLISERPVETPGLDIAKRAGVMKPTAGLEIPAERDEADS